MQFIKPNTIYPFIPKRKPFLLISTALVLIGLILPFVKAPNLGTSFRGGSSIIVHFDEAVSSEEVRSAFASKTGYGDVSVQAFGGTTSKSYMIKTRNTTSMSCDKLDEVKGKLPGALANAGVASATIDTWPKCAGEGVRGDFSVRFVASVEPPATEDPAVAHDKTLDKASGISAGALETAVRALDVEANVAFDPSTRRFLVKPSGLQSEITTLLAQSFPNRFNPDTGLDEIVTVGADVGEKFRNDGIVSILFALGLILLYIAIRFDIRFAPGAVVALIHDVIITFGLITLFGMEVTLETVAALLAIVGYSLNDTIVTFDRIRENTSSGTAESLPEIVNRSINECLSRTVLTSLTTLVAIIALTVIGTGVIQDFATTLVIGIIVGTYSSIFVASPTMLWLDAALERRKVRLETRRKLEEAQPTS